MASQQMVVERCMMWEEAAAEGPRRTAADKDDLAMAMRRRDDVAQVVGKRMWK